jgi:uncharacterized protein (DUF1697 family)
MPVIHIALFRGINVCGHNNVATDVQRGNVLFSPTGTSYKPIFLRAIPLTSTPSSPTMTGTS